MHSAFADSATQVIFVGGQGSSEQNMQTWAALVGHDSKYKDHFSFRSLSLPSTQSKQTRVIIDGQKTIEVLVSEIDHSPKDSQFILVGHSSGSAISNEVARRVKSKLKIKLIVLDGFVPHRVVKEIPTYCWSAVDASSGKPALNTNRMKKCSQYQEMKIFGCKTSHCLHFSLVNSSAQKANLGSKNYKTLGYSDLVPNLNWLDSLASTKIDSRTRSSDSNR